jgi:uncharacterized repeat protein (TIGR01451 family)
VETALFGLGRPTSDVGSLADALQSVIGAGKQDLPMLVLLANADSAKQTSAAGMLGEEVSFITTFAWVGISLTQTASPATARVGNTLTYRAIISNDDATTANNLVLSSTVPSALTIQSVIPSQGTCTITGQNVSCALGLLPGGVDAEVAYTIVPTAAAAGTTVSHTMTLTLDEDAADPAGLTNTVTLPVVGQPTLTLQILSDSEVVEAGGRFTYTMKV